VYFYTSIRCFRISSFNWYSNPKRSWWSCIIKKWKSVMELSCKCR
jgi:hypothetical protein